MWALAFTSSEGASGLNVYLPIQGRNRLEDRRVPSFLIHWKIFPVFTTPPPLFPGVWTHASIQSVSFYLDRIKPSWL